MQIQTYQCLHSSSHFWGVENLNPLFERQLWEFRAAIFSRFPATFPEQNSCSQLITEQIFLISEDTLRKDSSQPNFSNELRFKTFEGFIKKLEKEVEIISQFLFAEAT